MRMFQRRYAINCSTSLGRDILWDMNQMENILYIECGFRPRIASYWQGTSSSMRGKFIQWEMVCMFSSQCSKMAASVPSWIHRLGMSDVDVLRRYPFQ